jgi:phosphonate transport system substrate-binding protein
MARTHGTAVAVIWLCALLVLGCNKESSGPATPAPPQRQSFVIGLIPEQSLFKQVDRYEPLARYLSLRIGADVKLVILPRYEQILDSFTSHRVDAAFFGSFTYILAHTKLGVQVIARPVGLNGVSTYQGLLFVRKDSAIRSIRDMRGKRFAFVDRDTMAGYLLPLAYFKKAGVDYRTYLKESYFAGTHEDAIHDVLDRKADIGAAKNTEFERLATADARVKDELLILARSPEVPENSLAVRSDLDPVMKEKLKKGLLAMHENELGARILKNFGSQRFLETTDNDFKPVYKYARELGINLSTWNQGTVR